MSDFPEGIFFKLPNQNAPEFVKGKISINREKLISYLESMSDDWLNYDVKVSREGKPYLALDTWKPDKSKSNQKDDSSNEKDDFPF